MSRKFFLCDLETTSKIASCAQIVTGYFALYDENYNLIKELYLEVKPRRWDFFAESASKIHGITKEESMKFKPWNQAMLDLYNWLPDEPCHFVCHARRRLGGRQTCYDYGVLLLNFLDCSFEIYQFFLKIFPKEMIISTHSLFCDQIKLPYKTKYSLENCCNFLSIKHKGAHHAKNDGEATWKVFLKLITKVKIDEFCKKDFEAQSESGESEEDEGPEIREVIQPTEGLPVFEIWDSQELLISN
jgi:DNA polymerase III epsilon subunit-like protein